LILILKSSIKGDFVNGTEHLIRSSSEFNGLTVEENVKCVHYGRSWFQPL